MRSILGKEISIAIGQNSIRRYEEILKYIIAYIESKNPSIFPDQSIAYHSWIFKFALEGDDKYTLHEVTADGSGYIKGGETAITVISDQESVCIEHGVAPSFCSFSQMIVVSNGVMEGLAVHGVRYLPESSMSGWWQYTDDYNGNIENMTPVHFYHIAFQRPDILKYFALPEKFRFYHSDLDQEVRYDAKVK